MRNHDRYKKLVRLANDNIKKLEKQEIKKENKLTMPGNFETIIEENLLAVSLTAN